MKLPALALLPAFLFPTLPASAPADAAAKVIEQVVDALVERQPADPEARATDWTVPGLDTRVLALALQARSCAVAAGEDADAPLTVIDYSLPSTEKRLWVLDVDEREVLFHEHVAHGTNTGALYAERFSNRPNSNQTSLGLFRAAETYVGKHGRSLKLDGLEPGVNDRARARAIVIHGADYVSEATIRAAGRLGRSWGCPALAREVAQEVIDSITGGGLVFAYYPDRDWLEGSAYLSCAA